MSIFFFPRQTDWRFRFNCSVDFVDNAIEVIRILFAVEPNAFYTIDQVVRFVFAKQWTQLCFERLANCTSLRSA